MNSRERWKVRVDPKVYKKLKKIPREQSARIVQDIVALPLNPYAGDIQKIKGEESSWRRRVGDYRIFYDINSKGNVIEVTHVERRTSTTYAH